MPNPQAVPTLYRRHMHAVSVDTIRQTVALWRLLDPVDVDKAWPLISRALTQMIARNYSASTALAVAYVQSHAAAAGVQVRPLAAPAISLPRVETSLTVTGPVAVKTAARSGMSPSQASATALVCIAGAASRLALAGGRNTVQATVRGNAVIVGWRRDVSAGACKFCTGLRGEVGKTDLHFAAHDHCGCTSSPVYR